MYRFDSEELTENPLTSPEAVMPPLTPAANRWACAELKQAETESRIKGLTNLMGAI